MFQQNYGPEVCKHGPKSQNVGVLGNMWFIWWPEECTAGAYYLSRILWLDKELLEKLCCVAFFIYWYVVRRNRCLADSCGYISNWAWWLLKFSCMLFNSFKHTSAEDCCHSTSLTTPQGREELWGTHRDVSLPLPPFYGSRSIHAKCPQKLRVLPWLGLFIPGSLCPLCDMVLWSAAGERIGCCCGLQDGVLLWPGHCRIPGIAASSISFIFSPSGKWAGSVPTECTWSWRILLGKMSPLTKGWRETEHSHYSGN